MPVPKIKTLWLVVPDKNIFYVFPILAYVIDVAPIMGIYVTPET